MKQLKEITESDLLEIVIMEEVINSLEYWNRPTSTDFNNTMFSNTVWIDYFSIRSKDGLVGIKRTFFFNVDRLSFHQDENDTIKRSHGRIKLESIAFLISKGYHIPHITDAFNAQS